MVATVGIRLVDFLADMVVPDGDEIAAFLMACLPALEEDDRPATKLIEHPLAALRVAPVPVDYDWLGHLAFTSRTIVSMVPGL